LPPLLPPESGSAPESVPPVPPPGFDAALSLEQAAVLSETATIADKAAVLRIEKLIDVPLLKVMSMARPTVRVL
jgi:hypothetical protein